MGLSEPAVAGQDGGAGECRVAVVGAGAMAREHIRAFQHLAGVRVVGISSRTRARAESLAREYAIPAVCDDVDELWEHTRADLVVVAVPELATREVSGACFRRPWTILLEKPVGVDLAQAEEIAAAARAAGARAYVALNRRTYASTTAVRADLDARPGTRFIQALDQQDQAAARAGGQPEEVARSWMFANSIHTIDLLRVLGRGSVSRVDPVIPWDPDSPGPVVSRIEFESGDLALYEGIWNGPGPWALFVTTESRRWEMRPLESAAYQDRGERRLSVLAGDAADAEFKPGFLRQAESAVAVVRGLPSELATLDDSLETMRLIDRIFAPRSTPSTDGDPRAVADGGR